MKWNHNDTGIKVSNYVTILCIKNEFFEPWIFDVLYKIIFTPLPSLSSLLKILLVSSFNVEIFDFDQSSMSLILIPPVFFASILSAKILNAVIQLSSMNCVNYFLVILLSPSWSYARKVSVLMN